jgi:hypothetical protein
MIKYFLFFWSITAFSQTIKGTVSDSIGTVPFANVLIKKLENPGVIFQFTTTNENGFFQLKLKEKPELLLVEFTSLAHEPKTVFLRDFINKDNIVELNTKLSSRITQLKEVIIEKKIAIQVKEDTVTYNPNSFKDGTEKVVEDLLKKLPGIKVDEKGKISYKGKEIKSMLLDGDDLFDKDYVIGSKNIDVNMIDKVQAIDNYEENSLLKGIKDSDEVALNLVLKKGKTDLSGSVSLGYGYESFFNNSISAVLVNSKIKGFGIINQNNIGENISPFDLDYDFNSKDKSSKTLLQQGNFNSVLDSKFYRINNSLFATSNLLFKIKKKSSVKINLGFYNDNIKRLNENNSNFRIGEAIFSTNEVNEINKKPIIYDARILLSNKEKEFFHWQYIGKLNYSKGDFFDNSNNNGILQNNTVHTESLFINQNINSTYKINEKTVLLSTIDYNKSNAPQNLNINPGTLIDINNNLFSANQESKYNNQSFHIKSALFSKRDSIKYAVQVEYASNQSQLFSLLKDLQNNTISNDYKNDNDYRINHIAIKPQFLLKYNKFQFRLGLNTIYNIIDFKEFSKNNEVIENELITTPIISAIYYLNRKSYFNTSYRYNAILPEEEKLFSGIIQNNYRSFSNNIFSLEFLKTHTYSIGYKYNDFMNVRNISIDLSHNLRPNNYFSSFQINENITINNAFYAPIGTRDYNINLFAESYFHPLRTTYRINSSYTISYDKNTINNSDIRDIKANTLNTIFTLRTKFSDKFILENNFNYMNNSFEVLNTTSNFQSFNQMSKVVYNPTKEINISAISNFIKPDLSQSIQYLFLESEIGYSPKNKSYSFGLIAKNLTNIKTFETRNISDFSSSVSSHNLIEKYIMFSVRFSY